MSTSRAALCFLVLAACGPGVHDLRVSSAPLVEVHGHVDLAKLERTHPDVPLVGALVWAGLPVVHKLCVKYADNPALAKGCNDPYGVWMGELEHASPVDADGNFTVTLEHLPLAGNSIGDTVTRIAYGTLVVGEDLNHDGQLNLEPGGKRANNPVNGPPTPGTPPGGPKGELGGFDVILGASFWHLEQAQERLVFREGGFVSPSNFYPAPQCAEPPQGFSVLRAPPYGTQAACLVDAADAAIEVQALSTADADALLCRRAMGRGRSGFGGDYGPQMASYAQMPSEEQAPDPMWLALVSPICLSHEVMVVVPTADMGAICPDLQVWSLKACWNDVYCEKPEWDLTAKPPSWWPC